MTDHLRPELRREAPTDLRDVGQDDALVERIRAEIRRAGPMSFARFMELALYAPDGGYYRDAATRPGREGDFITAPELHPIFGWSLARGLDEIWRRLGEPSPFVVREHGAGGGALAVAILDGLRDMGSTLLDVIAYEPVEIDARRLEAFTVRLAAAGHGGRQREPAGGSFTGVVLGNEVLDALPVHRVGRRADRLVELAVGLGADDAFVEVETELTTPALAERLAAEGVELADGQTAEVCLALDDWIAAA